MKQNIFKYYIKSVLENDKEPSSVYRFCKDLKIKESEFYKYFPSLDYLKGQIFLEFYKNTYSLIKKEKGYISKSPKEKLLSFYFTFFEVLERFSLKFYSNPSESKSFFFCAKVFLIYSSALSIFP